MMSCRSQSLNQRSQAQGSTTGRTVARRTVTRRTVARHTRQASTRDLDGAAREEERTGPGNPFLHPVLTSLMQCIPDAQARERRGAAPLV